jgi:hypothetical protein
MAPNKILTCNYSHNGVSNMKYDILLKQYGSQFAYCFPIFIIIHSADT